MEEKRAALAEMLGVDESEITQSEYEENIFEVSDGREYLVVTDDEADDAFYDTEMNLIDDLGISAFSSDFQDTIFSEFVRDDDWFERAYRELEENYAYDIADEYDDTYGTRLVQECYDAGLITDEDFSTYENGDIEYTDCLIPVDELVERLVDYLVDSIDDLVDEFRFEFGDEEFNRLVEQNNLIDWDAVLEEVKEWDGRGSALAWYDGKELEWDDYYIYRTN